MPSFTIDVPHDLGQEEAHERLNSFLAKLQDRYKDQISDMDGQWDGNVLNYHFTTFGIKINGAMTVEEEKVQMHGELPFAAIMFKGKITSEIKEALTRALK